MEFTAKKVLIVYFSKKGENWYINGLKNLSKGNTEILAEEISFITGGDLFEIVAKKPYPDGYEDCCRIAKEEWTSKARPELVNHKDAEHYDVVFVGWPCWYGTMPMAVYTWLEENDNLRGKIAIPFETNEGSNWGRGQKDFLAALPGATVLPGFAVRGHLVEKRETELRDWLKSL